MTDGELLEFAAKAVGIDYKTNNEDWKHQKHCAFWSYDDLCTCGALWNPLTDDGDALRLAVKLGLVVDCSRPSAGEPWKQHAIWLDELMSNAELTRRAIVRAAAEIGRQIP